MITPNLIGKCLLIGGAGAATGTGIYFIQKSYFSNNEELKALAEKVGLICEGNPTETSGVECSKKEGADVKVKVKKDSTSSDIELSSLGGTGKIKAYKDEGYDGKFKFVIEDGDVADGDTKKLEQFETYEIKEEPKETWKLNRKSDAKTEIKKALGLPADATCDLPTDSSSEKTCSLTVDKLKAINFEGKTKEMAVVNAASSETLTLKISKPSTEENNQFPLGYKFELQSNKDIKLGGDKSIKKGTNTEFKIKVTPATGGPKVLTLEKAWSVVELGKKVGLVCPETVASGTAGNCSLTDTKINVKNGTDTNKKFSELSKKEGDDANKNVKVEIGQDSHNQGFKFYAEQEICLKTAANGENGQDKKIEAKGNVANSPVTYEIKKDTDGKWYLTKKNGTSA